MVLAERSLSYGILLPAVMPIMKKIRQTTRKIKNRNLATPAAATAMPVNPNTAATNAITKKITAQRNNFLPPSRRNRTAQPLRVPLNRYCYASSLKFLELAAQEPNLRRWRYQNVCFGTTASDCAVATPAGFFVLLKKVPWGRPGCRFTTGKKETERQLATAVHRVEPFPAVAHSAAPPILENIFYEFEEKRTAAAGSRVSSLSALSLASTKIRETNNTIFNLHVHPRFIGGGAGNQTR
jgi:hypothetical protein